MLMIEDMHNICIGQGEQSKFYDLVTYCSTRGTAQYLQIGKSTHLIPPSFLSILSFSLTETPFCIDSILGANQMRLLKTRSLFPA